MALMSEGSWDDPYKPRPADCREDNKPGQQSVLNTCQHPRTPRHAQHYTRTHAGFYIYCRLNTSQHPHTPRHSQHYTTYVPLPRRALTEQYTRYAICPYLSFTLRGPAPVRLRLLIRCMTEVPNSVHAPPEPLGRAYPLTTR